MGRKIPGRKHRGTRDPEKQRRQRFNSIKNKINLTPSDPEVQETPHSINQIAKLKEESKSIRYQKPKRKRSAVVDRKKGETKRQLLYRVHKACEVVIQENAFENKYGVNIKRNPQTGEVEGLVKKPKDEIDQLMKKMRKKKKQGKSKKITENKEPVLTKPQKRRKKIKEKKLKKDFMHNTYDTTKDNVKFGEVVHAPPVLSAPKHVVKAPSAARPGQKELLLSSLMQRQSASSPPKGKLNKVANKVIDKTGKRKDLPNALRRKLEQQQTEIIQAYRLLKKQKRAAV